MILLAEKSSGSPLGLLLPLVVLFVVFYFFLIRPQQRRSRQQQNLLAELHPGDEVVTIGGLFAEVVVVADDYVIIEMYDGTQAKFLKSAISRRLGGDVEAQEDTPADDEEVVPEVDAKPSGRGGRPKASGARKTDTGGDDEAGTGGDEGDDAGK